MSWLGRLFGTAFPEAAPQLDLHGLRVPEALEAVARALEQAERDGTMRLRIVCGKGRGSPGGVGVLREAVAGWLDARGYSRRYRRDVDRDGRDGAIRVEVRHGPVNRARRGT